MGQVAGDFARHSWHSQLYRWSYANFDRRPPMSPEPAEYVVGVLFALLYLFCAVVILIVLNAATLPFAVFVEPVWKKQPRFRLLKLAGVPIIVPAAAILGIYAMIRHENQFGLVLTLGSFITATVLALLLFAIVIASNRLGRSERADYLKQGAG